MEAEDALCHAIKRLLEPLGLLGDETCLGLARLLYQRAAFPQSYVTLAGETSSGKSTLANALLGESLLPTSASPTAGTVTHVRCMDADQVSYLAINRDGTQESLDRESFVKLTREPDDNLLRLEVRTRPRDTAFLGLNLFDTPGYNSLIYRHEEALRAFLPQSDAIVYVVSYRVGVGQSDQELLELVSDIRDRDPELPILVVVNRAPQAAAEQSRRSREIRGHVGDCLSGTFSFHVVGTAGPQSPEGHQLAIPGLDPVWDDVREALLSDSRHAAVVAKLAVQAVALVDEADSLAERRELSLTAGEEDQQDITDIRARLQEAERLSLEAVDRSMARLERMVPRTLRALSKDMQTEIGALVMKSDRWLGKDECIAFIEAHALPRAVRRGAQSVEDSIAQELKRLEEELVDIANTAIKAIESSAVVRSDAVERFAKNIAIELARRIGGSAASSALRALGGVGGAAAGAGNLVKMLLSRGGRLVGHVFSRRVYDAIGRFFTKRMLARLNVAVLVLVDAVGFVWDARTWQKKLEKLVGKAIDAWREAVEKDVAKQDLPALRSANVDGVLDAYALRMEQEGAGKDAESEADRAAALAQLASVRSELDEVRRMLTAVEGGAA